MTTDTPATSISHSISDGFVHLRYFGLLSADDLIAQREAFMADPQFTPGMSFLVDFREASLRELDTGELERVAAHATERMAHWGQHRSAVVAPRDIDFGLSRVYEVIGRRPGLEPQVFRDVDSALSWLRGST